MGFRFRKRIALGKFARINLSKSGVSLGLGPPGLNVNFSNRGRRTTVGLPGSGIYWQSVSKTPLRFPTLNAVHGSAGSQAKRIAPFAIAVGSIVFSVLFLMQLLG